MTFSSLIAAVPDTGVAISGAARGIVRMFFGFLAIVMVFVIVRRKTAARRRDEDDS